MLIDFSVSNFRSFRDKQTFSMVAAPRLRKNQNCILPKVKGETLPKLLKVAAIYGPNASGKSNLIKAMTVISTMTKWKPDNENGKNIPVSPFRFDPSLQDQPSSFEVNFISAGLRYLFELKLTSERVALERLTAYPRGKDTLIYSRTYASNEDEYRFDGLEGDSSLHEVWKNLTSKKHLFIAQAVANSNEKLEQLRKPLAWLSTMKTGLEATQLSGQSIPIKGVDANKETDMTLTRLFLSKDANFRKTVSTLLSDVDIPVKEIRVDENPLGETYKDSPSATYKTILTQVSALGLADFGWGEISDGTKNLINFAVPWEIFAELPILLVDEIDNSLHPKIVEAMISRFLLRDKSTQLIFTTHDTHLMDAKLLRRDQFWLTERDINGATQLRSIYDFVEGREGEDIEKRYYEGRYRSLPFIKNKLAPSTTT